MNERIDARGLGKSRFQGDGGESHLLYQKAKHPISEGHGFVSAMQGLFEGNDTRCAYDGLQWKQICEIVTRLDRRDREGMSGCSFRKVAVLALRNSRERQ